MVAKLLSIVPIINISTGHKIDRSFDFAASLVLGGVAKWDDQRFLDLLVEDIKADIRAERKLMRCKSFGELHDVCDANCLGDLCDDEHPIWKICPGMDNPPPGVDGTAGRFVNGRDVVENAQDAVDAWIKNGHPK